jgi:L-asparagine permease
MPGSPWTSIVGLVFLALVLVGLGISGWQSSPYFWHKTAFIVVVIGIPIIAVVLLVGWLIVRPKVVAHTGDRMGSVWTDDGPRYGSVDVAGELDPDDRAAHDDVPPDESYFDIKP